jgi:rare lipoprotein A
MLRSKFWRSVRLWPNRVETRPFFDAFFGFLNLGVRAAIKQWGSPLKKAVLAAAFVLAFQSHLYAESIGQASFYHHPRYNGFIAAHRTYPFGTHLRVTNLGNGRQATVVVVDRGPFIRNRILDVSTNAAEALGFRQAGLARVKIEVLGKY